MFIDNYLSKVKYIIKNSYDGCFLLLSKDLLMKQFFPGSLEYAKCFQKCIKCV